MSQNTPTVDHTFQSLAKWIESHPRKAMRDYMLKSIDSHNAKTNDVDLKIDLEQNMFDWQYQGYRSVFMEKIRHEYYVRALALIKDFVAMRRADKSLNKVVITGENGYACVLHYSNKKGMFDRGGHYFKPAIVLSDCMYEYMCLYKNSTCEVDELKFRLMNSVDAAKATNLPVGPNTTSSFSLSFYEEYEKDTNEKDTNEKRTNSN